jgi:hypothetical protein
LSSSFEGIMLDRQIVTGGLADTMNDDSVPVSTK